MPNLDPVNIPAPLAQLIPMAETWGVSDDFERDQLVLGATREQLETLVHSIDDISDEDLFGWLSGPESFNPNPSNEYLAMTCLTLAIDSAKLRLQRMA